MRLKSMSARRRKQMLKERAYADAPKLGSLSSEALADIEAWQRSLAQNGPTPTAKG